MGGFSPHIRLTDYLHLVSFPCLSLAVTIQYRIRADVIHFFETTANSDSTPKT